MSFKRRNAFTLVELLVVIAIIGVLVALLLPAVQAAREAARRAQCSNQLRQIALAWQLHHDAQGFFPSAGWGYKWTGDPDRGYGKSQSGSWAYSCLPYMEQGSLHQMGEGLTGAAKRAALAQALQTPVAAFYCPSRRAPQAYTNADAGLGAGVIHNADNPPTLARSDYAANLGPFTTPDDFGKFGVVAPDPYRTYTQWGPGPSPQDAEKGEGFRSDILRINLFEYCLGLSYQQSEIELKHITDGASNTYLVGEKYMNSDYYDGGHGSNFANKDIGDDQGAWMGDDLDLNRNTGPPDRPTTIPLRDRPGLAVVETFGSAHPATFQMATCDAAVRVVSYDIDPLVHHAMGTRAGGETPSGG